MLDSSIKRELLDKLDNLITEKQESELLRKEFIDWFNSGKPFLDVMNESEKRILEKYPNLVVKKDLLLNLYSSIRWNSYEVFGNKIFEDNKEKKLVEDDNPYFYNFDLITYPSLFDMPGYYNYNITPLDSSNKKIVEQVSSKIWNLLKVRKRYLEKREFIKRVLDSRELTLTVLKNDYIDLYNLLDHGKG